jgi:hypothetical protein
VIDSYTIQVTTGKKGKYNGKIRVETPDQVGDILIVGQGECGEEHSLYMRPEEARLLARVLLQVTEDE